MTRRFLAISALALGLAAGSPGTPLGTPVAAQTTPPAQGAGSNKARQLSGFYTPPREHDLLHQRIEVLGVDWDSTSLDGRVTSTFVARRAGADSLVLAAGRGIDVRRVEIPPAKGRGRAGSRRGTALRHEHTGDTLVVRLPRGVKPGDTLRVRIEYRARVEHGRGLFFIPRREGHAGTPQVYTSGGTDGNPRWLPTVGSPDDKATWETIVTVPAGLTVVSNGRLVADRPAPGGRRTVHWALERPASTYLVSFVAAPLVRVRDSLRALPVDYWVYPDDTARVAPAFGHTPDVLATLERLTGTPYPWGKYAQVTVADYFGGMENVTATTILDWLPDSTALHDRPWFRHVLVPHEAAHSWFGNLVTAENWANYWLNEGSAHFMAAQYWAAKLGPRAEEDFLLDELRAYRARDAQRRMPLASWYSNVVYPKGALVLGMLKTRLGAERFWAGIRRYLETHAYGNATSDDLRRALETASGMRLERFFDEWVYGAGHPEIVVQAVEEPEERRLRLLVWQTQRDTLRPDSTGLRFEVPEAFHLPIAVRVGTDEGDVVRRFDVRARVDTLVIDSLPGAPTMVAFDDENAVVKRLVFPQPTAWLAALLERHESLWQRSWAIEQLRTRLPERTAAEALARTARRADHPRIRAEASAALVTAPAAIATPALEEAAADTSARVREVAVGALAQAGGARTLPLLRRVWTSDSSYETRAAALAALGRLMPKGPERDSLLRAGLGTPSYRDVIADAALVAIVQGQDTALVGEVAARLGDLERAALALAALAGQGSPAAGRALVAALRDPREPVRRRAIDALERGMPRETAATLLRQQPAPTGHADADSAVRRLLAPAAAR